MCMGSANIAIRPGPVKGPIGCPAEGPLHQVQSGPYIRGQPVAAQEAPWALAWPML